MFKSVVESYTLHAYTYCTYIYEHVLYFVYTSYIYQYIEQFSLVFVVTVWGHVQHLGRLGPTQHIWPKLSSNFYPKGLNKCDLQIMNFFAKFGVSSLQTVFYLIIFRFHLFKFVGMYMDSEYQKFTSSECVCVCVFLLRDWHHHQKLPYVQSLPIKGQRTNSNGHPPISRTSSKRSKCSSTVDPQNPAPLSKSLSNFGIFTMSAP